MSGRVVSPAVANSRVAQVLAPIARGSLFWGLARRPLQRATALWRDAGRVDEWLDAQVGPAAPVVPPVVAHSRVIAPAFSIGERLQRAARTATTVQWMIRAAGGWRELSTATAVRLTGITLLTAIATHGLALLLMPARLRPAVPWQVGVFAVVVAATMMLAHGAVARAWMQWRKR